MATLPLRTAFVFAASIWVFCAAFSRADATPIASTRQISCWGWQLPQKLSDANTTVHFEVASTWHLLRGTTAGIEGKAWLTNPGDDLSVNATLNLPVARFSTGGEMRDERMREVMDEEHSHYVTLMVDSLVPKCSVQKFHETADCDVDVYSRLSIRGNERKLLLHGILRDTGDSIELVGNVRFSWLDFGVEDPSILVAKLEPYVSVEYSVKLPRAVKNTRTSP
jgi:polyisoprenoid-binding protein YceI